MSTQHTPGPWETERGGFRGAWVRGTQTKEWAALACGDTDESAAANAHLIAAAPDMLAALKAIVEFYGWDANDDGEYVPCRMAHAAIAKAEGKS